MPFSGVDSEIISRLHGLFTGQLAPNSGPLLRRKMGEFLMVRFADTMPCQLQPGTASADNDAPG